MLVRNTLGSRSLLTCVGQPAIRRALTATLISTTPMVASCVGTVGHDSRRTFWNPFSKDRASKAVSKLAADQVAQNEELVDASLEILKLSSSTELADEETAVLSEIVDTLFSDVSKKPAEQFDLVFQALRMPGVRAIEGLRGHLYVVMCSILPHKLYVVFRDVGEELELLEDVGCGDEDAQQEQSSLGQSKNAVFQLRRFVYFLLGDISLFDESVAEIDLDAIIAELEAAVPCLTAAPSYATLKASADSMVLTARLYSLIAELCAEFDTDKSGRISLEEFAECLGRVVGEADAKAMLSSITPDKEGKIKYHHVSSLLTKPSNGGGQK
jgi:hypothetical protein